MINLLSIYIILPNINLSFQEKIVLRNFNIREQALGPNTAFNITYKAEVQKEGDLLDIHLYWSGKGSNFDSPPVFNGPLISAISVTNGKCLVLADKKKKKKSEDSNMATFFI